MEGLVGFYAKLKLQINPAKSAVAPAGERPFLGFRFYRVVRGKIVKRQVSPKAIETMKARVRELTARSNGWSLAYRVVLLRRYLLGWQAYFRLAETPSVFAGIDGWIRRRLRALIIYQCRHGRKLFRVLRARGVPLHAAATAGRHSRRYWAIAAMSHSAWPFQQRTSIRLESRGWVLRDLNSLNRRMRARMSGGVGGVVGEFSQLSYPLSR